MYLAFGAGLKSNDDDALQLKLMKINETTFVEYEPLNTLWINMTLVIVTRAMLVEVLAWFSQNLYNLIKFSLSEPGIPLSVVAYSHSAFK